MSKSEPERIPNQDEAARSFRSASPQVHIRRLKFQQIGKLRAPFGFRISDLFRISTFGFRIFKTSAHPARAGRRVFGISALVALHLSAGDVPAQLAAKRLPARTAAMDLFAAA